MGFQDLSNLLAGSQVQLAGLLAQSEAGAGMSWAVAALAIAVIGLGVWLNREVNRRVTAESHVQALAAARQDSGEDKDRNNVLFAQHKQMNDLQIAKLSAEVELLRTQVADRPTDRDRIEASKEYHELMVEKTKLEMDALRLQIAEMRKRFEDWRIDD